MQKAVYSTRCEQILVDALFGNAFLSSDHNTVCILDGSRHVIPCSIRISTSVIFVLSKSLPLHKSPINSLHPGPLSSGSG